MALRKGDLKQGASHRWAEAESFIDELKQRALLKKKTTTKKRMEIPIHVAVRICPKGLLQLPQQKVVEEEEGKVIENKIQIKEEERCDEVENLKSENNTQEIKKKEFSEEDNQKCCVRAVPFINGGLPGLPAPGCREPPDVVQVGPHSFPVTHALPLDCSQLQVYQKTVLPMMTLFMEGFDASVVTYGQRGCGKTYTLYGQGPTQNENQGLVAFCVREIFNHIHRHPERTCIVNITWVEICREIIRDIFGVGSVQCMNLTDAFHWLQVGYKLLTSTKSQMGHSLFSITLEQRWISKEGLIQHRLSTASFTDLCATDRQMLKIANDQTALVPLDKGLQALECVIGSLIDPALVHKGYDCIPYNRSMLTTMLKDSFGGRAQTLVLVCISPWERDVAETMANMQFAFKVQCVHNFVVINSFSDDNTPAIPEGDEDEDDEEGGASLKKSQDPFALQFAANQWSKLVSNAEDLLSKLINSNAIGEDEKQQIESWLIQKQECDDCLNSNDSSQTDTILDPIQEEEGEMEAPSPPENEKEAEDSANELSDPDVTDPELSLPANSENESDAESQQPDAKSKLELLMQKFEKKTDEMAMRKYSDFMKIHPKAVTESQESGAFRKFANGDDEERRPSLACSERGRRRSIQPGSALSSVELAMLQQLATREQLDNGKGNKESGGGAGVQSKDLPWEGKVNSGREAVEKKIRKLDANIEGRMKQIQELEKTIQLKQNIIMDLVETSDTRTTAKQRFNKKRHKLQEEYDKSKKSLSKALQQRKDKREVERLKADVAHLEQRLNDVTSIKHIAGDSVQKVKKLQQSLKESQTLLENLKKKVEKEKKKKENLEQGLKDLPKEEELPKKVTKVMVHSAPTEEPPEMQEIQSRIDHLDHILKEKSKNLQQPQQEENGAQHEGLRHEIRNLRKTRDHLLDQRCFLDQKFKRDKALSQKEERKLLECDEAIEAIDAAIEFKNELICGNKSIDTDERLQREKGEQMLMARLNKLSNEEMRTLLYKYFNKVIDLRDSSRKLEMQLMQLEREKDAWEWKERVLSNAIRQAHLEGERKAILMQRQHEMKLTLMLRHMAEESSMSSASFSDQSLSSLSSIHKPSSMALVPTTMSITSSGNTDSDYQWPHQMNQKLNKLPRYKEDPLRLCPAPKDHPLPLYKQPLDAFKGKTVKVAAAASLITNNYTEPNLNWPMPPRPPKSNDMELCPLPNRTVTKYQKSDEQNMKIKEKESKNKLFAKFQVLTRYATSSQRHEDSATSNSSNSSGKSNKEVALLASPEKHKKSSKKGQKTKIFCALNPRAANTRVQCLTSRCDFVLKFSVILIAFLVCEK
ncbi:kinesin-like protein costa [Musca vetustissima]|uniref:kinesin-like protein costa n=1 Tax=Musca vetustissima TaxID=27455 RepID=UPI002AB790AC|nr:kinesin-like protein costa [Musca vetustissima]